ncbi:MAG: ABC transporter permease [Anaerolineae bacterium]|nr:ABC transporter permease [Anaerolineae bacterium]
MKKTLSMCWKTLLETARDWQLSGVYLLFPAAMIAMYFMAFGQTPSMSNWLTLLVDNRDRGVLGAQLVDALTTAQFDGQPIFSVRTGLDERSGRIALEEGKAALLLVIPADFTDALRSPTGSPAELEMHGDPLSDNYLFARSFLSGEVQAFIDRQTGWTRPPTGTYEFLPNTGKVSDFAAGVPGVLVFGVMFSTVASALMLARERSAGTLERLRMSGASGGVVLGGVALANLVMALVQAPISFGAALLMGFRSPGSLPLAIGITVLLCMGAVGCGFLSACFARSEGAAVAISTAVMTPLVFLSGAIFPMPRFELFRIGGQAVQLIDFMPTTPAASALSKVLLHGMGAESMVYELVLLVALCVGLLALGAVVYQRRVLRGL